MTVLTSKDDDFLYDRILLLLSQIKLVQGGSAIPPTLRRHKAIKDYLISKQKSQIEYIEQNYFSSGELDNFAIENYHTRLK